MIQKAIRSAAVWYLYFPQLWVLKKIGPRPAIILARAFALVHWVMMLLGTEARTRKAMRRAFPDMSRAELRRQLRKHLIVKYQNFVEWHLYGTPRGKKFVAETYRLPEEGRRRLEDVLSRKRGVLALVFHYGFGKMTWPALNEAGYTTYQHLFRGATYAGSTFPWVAKAALDAQTKSDRDSGLGIIYQRPNLTYVLLVRHLRRNEIVGMAADGMMGTEFVDAPFLDGTMPYPTGAARAAASAGTEIVPIFILPAGVFGHEMFVERSIPAPSTSPESIAEAVKAYVAALDRYVREYPYAWWTWRRLDRTRGDDGTVRYLARALTTEEGMWHEAMGSVPERKLREEKSGLVETRSS
jgi:lauroyl/myristoyl acyltransferase